MTTETTTSMPPVETYSVWQSSGTPPVFTMHRGTGVPTYVGGKPHVGSEMVVSFTATTRAGAEELMVRYLRESGKLQLLTKGARP